MGDEVDAEEVFEGWARRHGRAYASAEERARRQAAFAENRLAVRAASSRARAAGSSARFELNQFADWTDEEHGQDDARYVLRGVISARV